MTLVKDLSLAVTLSQEEEAELQAIQSARIALERSFALSSERAKAMQFYAELARSEGFSSAERVQDVALEAIDRLTRAFWLLDKISKRLQKVNKWIEQRQEQRQQVGSLEDEVARDLERVIKVNQKIYGILAEIYEEITTIVNSAWNYLPLELQVITESLVRRLFLGREELLLVKCLEKPYEQYTPEIYREKLRLLIYFVSSAVEQNKDKPKLELLKLSQHDASISWLKQKNQSLPQSEIGLAEIKEVVQKLAELPNVQQVRAIANSSNDLHEVTFEVLPSNIDSPENGELAKRAISLVIDAEWKLSDITNNESWLFGVQMVGGFELNPKDNRVVASSYVQP